MRKLIIATLSIVAMVSCTKEDTDNTKTELAASFTSSIETRASDNKWEQGDAIGIMVTQNNTVLEDYHYNNKHNVVLGTNAMICSFEADSNTDQIYYSMDESVMLDFYGYYPYRDNLDQATALYPINVEDQSSAKDLDFMEASTIGGDGYNKNSDAVALTFKHLMSKVSLKLVAGAGIDLSEITTLRLEGFYTSADYDFPTNSFTNIDQIKDITPLSEGNDLYSAILIPQNSSSHKVYITTSHGEIPLDITSQTLASGAHTYYTVTVSQTTATYQANTISSWGTASVEDDTFETE